VNATDAVPTVDILVPQQDLSVETTGEQHQHPVIGPSHHEIDAFDPKTNGFSIGELTPRRYLLQRPLVSVLVF
jgi:hypothetical protein